MVAELRLHRTDDLAERRRVRRLLELGDEGSGSRQPSCAALRADPVSVDCAAARSANDAPAASCVDDLLRRRFVGDEDVRDLFPGRARRERILVLLVVRPQRRLRWASAARARVRLLVGRDRLDERLLADQLVLEALRELLEGLLPP